MVSTPGEVKQLGLRLSLQFHSWLPSPPLSFLSEMGLQVGACRSFHLGVTEGELQPSLSMLVNLHVITSFLCSPRKQQVWCLSSESHPERFLLKKTSLSTKEINSPKCDYYNLDRFPQVFQMLIQGPKDPIQLLNMSGLVD